METYQSLNDSGYEDPSYAYFPHERFYNVSKVVLPIIIFILVLIGVVGNGMVLFVICRHRDMKTITNFFIANLAVSDIAFLITCAIPSALVVAGVLNMEVAMCKGINYIMFVTVQATCLTLTAMSIDRYDLIVNAVKSRKSRTTTKALTINVTVWIGSFILHIPVAVYSDIHPYSGTCDTIFASEVGLKIFHIVASITMYLGPLLIILACYFSILLTVWRKTWKGTASAMAHARSIYRKRKITRMVFIVVLLFAICWAPAHFIRVWQACSPDFYKLMVRHFKLLNSITFFALCLSYFNSCCNPFIYAFTTTSFKGYFKKLFAKWAWCIDPNAPQSGITRSMPTKTTKEDAECSC